MVFSHRVLSRTVMFLVLPPMVGHVSAQVVSPGAGVTFRLPPGFVSQLGRPAPITMSWYNTAGTISIDAIVIGYPAALPPR